MRFLRSLDLRYKDQVYECTIDITDVTLGSADAVSELETRFHRRHELLYDFSQPGYSCELITLGLSAIAPSPRLDTSATSSTELDKPEKIAARSVLFDRNLGTIDTPVYNGDTFPLGHTIHGPAIIEESHTTIVVPPDVTASLHPAGAFLLDLNHPSGRRDDG